MRKSIKRAVSMALACAVIVSGMVNTGVKASAASKYNAYLMFASSDWKCVNMNEKVANTSIKNKKGTANYTVTLKRAKATDGKEGKASAAEDACVLCVDIKNILKDHKASKVKFSKVVVKCDGKVVKTNFKKMAQGMLEPKKDPKKCRLEIYNEYGEGGTVDHPCAKPTAFKWKKSISVSFKLKIKK